MDFCLLISAIDINHEFCEGCDCVDSFLQKPVTIPHLITEVKMLLSNSMIA